MIRLFNQYFPLRKVLFITGEWVLITVAVLSSLICHSKLNFYSSYPLLLALKISIILFVYQVSLYFSDFYSAGTSWNYKKVILRLIAFLLIAFFLIPVIYQFTPLTLFENDILLSIALFTFIFILPWRIAYSWFLKIPRYKKRTLILGSSELAKNIAREALQHQDMALNIVGFIANDPRLKGVSLVNPKVIGNMAELPEIVRENDVEKIIVALEERRGELPVDRLLHFRSLGISIEDGVDFYEKATNKLLIEYISPSNLIFCKGFRLSRVNMFFKRLFDMCIAMIGLLLASPLFAIIPVLIKLESEGPVFFAQKRVGKDSKPFNIYKFRTMCNDAEKLSGPTMSFIGDKRVTGCGKFFRKTRLDELPQLWNVLRGDMSFVGPRPERPVFVEKFTKEIPFYNQRFALRPGITGWAQIRSSYAASVEETLEKLRYELYYLKNFSLLFDLTIILRTAKVVLFTRGSA